jgi:hypothetical protein
MADSGQQLRQDDPSALKDIIEIVQRKVSIKDDGVKCVPCFTFVLANLFICYKLSHTVYD